MRARTIGRSHILKLERGDEIVRSINDYCQGQKIYGGKISGIGSVDKAELALYDLKIKQYYRKEFEAPMELVSLLGNVCRFEGKALAHLHASFSLSDFSTISGHLVKGRVYATAEIVIEPFGEPIEKMKDEEIGLNLMKL